MVRSNSFSQKKLSQNYKDGGKKIDKTRRYLKVDKQDKSST